MYRVGFVCSMNWLLHFLKITELGPRPKGYCVSPKIVGGSGSSWQQLFSECFRLESNAGINPITALSVFFFNFWDSHYFPFLQPYA
ncbi:hypothetical protein YC2023_007396 [Brassica napus]